MAAKLATISSSLITKLPKLSSPSSSHTIIFCPPSPRLNFNHFKINAKLGTHVLVILGGEELKPDEKKKFITKEQEPEQYWQSAGEREGENPMKTPLPYIIIFGMSTPFIILAVAFANGWVKVPIR